MKKEVLVVPHQVDFDFKKFRYYVWDLFYEATKTTYNYKGYTKQDALKASRTWRGTKVIKTYLTRADV